MEQESFFRKWQLLNQAQSALQCVWNLMVHYSVQLNLPITPVLNQINQVF